MLFKPTHTALTLKNCKYNLEHRVKDIHKEAVRIAKRASNEDTFILGTVGGFRNIRKVTYPLSPFNTIQKYKLRL